MNDPQPLKQVTSHACVRELLQSVEADQSPVGAADRALSMLGIVTLSATGAAVIVSREAATTAHAGVTSLASKSIALATIKWVCVGFLGGLVTVGSAANVFVKTSPPGISRALGAVRSARPSVRPDAAIAQAPLMATVAPTPTPPNELPAARTVPVRVQPMSGARGIESFSSGSPPTPLAGPDRAQMAESNAGAMAQLEALRAIRAELTARGPARALTSLDAFDRRFGTTTLAEEAVVLRVEALAALGRKREAQQLGVSFLAQHPKSAYARHVQATLGFP